MQVVFPHSSAGSETATEEVAVQLQSTGGIAVIWMTTLLVAPSPAPGEPVGFVEALSNGRAAAKTAVQDVQDLLRAFFMA
jgi:hypothetical protein